MRSSLTRLILLTVQTALNSIFVDVECCEGRGFNFRTSFFKFLVKYYSDLAPTSSAYTRDENNFDNEYDFVIIGAGSSGSVLANRLTEISFWSVLLIEAGKEEIFLTDVPLLASYVVGTDYNWHYKTERQRNACWGLKKSRCNWPRGKAMGGTSVINYMVYTRGFRSDYDNWARLGNYGWSYDDVLPYFLKSEDVRDERLAYSKWHGRGGFLKVERAAWRSPLAPYFMNACAALGFNTRDPHGLNPMGCSYVLATLDRGARCSASKAFLRPIRRRPNLHVSKRTFATRVLIDPRTKRARGVEFVKNNKLYRIGARKEVIVSAGALNSPQLLMLSGIGPRRHLNELKIPLVRDSMVGYNLQDHVSMAGLTFLVNDTVTVIENRYRSVRYTMDYALSGRGPYTIPGGAEMILFACTKCCSSTTASTDDDVNTPDIELVFGPGALTGDSGGSMREMLNLDDELFGRVYEPFIGKDAWAAVPVLLKPKSKGYVRLRSRNPFDPPLFYPNYFQDERDLHALVDAIKQAIALSRTPSLQKFASSLLPIPIPGCRYLPFASDIYWMCASKYITTNLHHQVGTCKMGPDTDSEAVVDPELRVRGITGLRVVDASIMPVIPAAHTNAVVFMIGEKAADMIKADWLKNVYVTRVNITRN